MIRPLATTVTPPPEPRIAHPSPPSIRRRGSGIAAFIFDVDGVLADTARLHTAAWRKLAEDEGLPFHGALHDSFRGLPRAESLRRLLAGRQVSPEKFAAMLERKNGHYLDSLQGLGPSDRLPGTAHLLDGLRRCGVQLAAASASRNARIVLGRVGLIDIFEVVVDGRDAVESDRRVDRFVLAAERLEVDPCRCAVVEDAAEAIEIARRLEMRTIGIGERDRLESADMAFESLRGVEAKMLLFWLEGLRSQCRGHSAAS